MVSELKDEDLIDPACDPAHPVKVDFSDISSAAFAIRGGVVLTPLSRSNQLSDALGIELFMKKEFLQVTGSFKERGARFALLRLSEAEKKAGAIAASAGNHAMALAYHGLLLGILVTVVMPIFAPLMKRMRCQAYGANVILHGTNIQESKEHAFKLGHQKGMKYINGFDYPCVVAGQGTIGLEILEEMPDVDAILVPVGGGGLIAGVAMAVKTLKPDCKVSGVESEQCPSFQNALKDLHIEVHPEVSIADGLAVPTVGCNAAFMAKDYVDDVISVCEESIALAILRLLEMEKAVVEGAGAVCIAALISGKLPELKGKKVACILTGGNIDTTILGRTIERGLAVDGRLIKFDVVVSDRPGGIADLTALISKSGASIKDIFHERAWLAANVFSVRVRVVAETRDRAHVKELEDMLRKKYQHVEMTAPIPTFETTASTFQQGE